MSATRQRVLLGTSRPTLTIDWPTGRLSSAPLVYVYDPDYPWTDSPNPRVDGATASQNAVNTTTNGAAAADATSFVVTSATGISAGSLLWIAPTGAPATRIEVKSLSGTTITPRTPLPFAVASGAAVQSGVCTYQLPLSLDTIWADDQYIGRTWTVKWSHSTGVYYTEFDTVLAQFGYPYKIESFYDTYPFARQMQPAIEKGLNFSKQVDAVQKVVEADLRLSGIDPDRLRGYDWLIERLITLKLAAMVAGINVKPYGRDAAQWGQEREAEYISVLTRATAGPLPIGTSMDDDEDGPGERFAQDLLVRGNRGWPLRPSTLTEQRAYQRRF